MNKKSTPIIVFFVIAIFVFFQAFFTVDETEVAIVTTFGEFKQSYTDPGLKFKTPFIDQVTKFDKRLQRVDVPPTHVDDWMTKDECLDDKEEADV